MSRGLLHYDPCPLFSRITEREGRHEPGVSLRVELPPHLVPAPCPSPLIAMPHAEEPPLRRQWAFHTAYVRHNRKPVARQPLPFHFVRPEETRFRRNPFPKETRHAMKIVLCYPVESSHCQQIAVCAPGAEIIDAGQERIAEALFEADIFCGHAKVPVDWDGVMRQGRLRWIQSSAAGMDHCLVPSVIQSDVVVTSASGVLAEQVAEHTIALITAGAAACRVSAAQAKQEFIHRPTRDLHHGGNREVWRQRAGWP